MSEQQQSELAGAIENVTSDPGNSDLWDQIEDLAGQLDHPDDVSTAYRSCLQGKMSPDDAVELGQRAARFHEEWYGDDPGGLADLLKRVLALNPKSEWAFQQLTVVLTVAERWDELIALYESVIAETTAKTRLLRLLDEAYQVTKDLANRPDRAIDFLKAKLELKPSAKQLVALERLMERHERWTDLIQLWRDALDDEEPDDRNESLAKIAETYFDKLNDGSSALDSLREVFDEANDNERSLQLLERISISEEITPALRESALTTVREVYEAADRHRDVVRVLGEVLPLCEEADRKGLHAELGERLSALEEHSAALDHYAALLVLDPSSVAAQRALRREAQLTDKFDRYASALASAAEGAKDPSRRVALLNDAAVALLEIVGDEPGAITLFLEAIATEDIKASDLLTVGKRLNVLLERAERSEERLRVLELLADAETVDSSKRAIIGDVARLAEELGEVDRALKAWQRRIDADSGDLRALDSFIDLLAKEQRWNELIQALTTRTEQDVADNQKRSDLARIATVYEEQLEEDEQALQVWIRVKETFGDTPQLIDALSRLMTKLGHWAELTSLLEQSNEEQVEYVANQFAHLGNAYRQSLGDDVKAIECYRRALSINLAHAGARAGLAELLEQEETRNVAAAALVHSLQSSGDFIGLLDIVDARLAVSNDPRKHAEVLREAADIAEIQAEDNIAALGFVNRLFPLEARDRVLEDRMIRLAKAAGDWEGSLAAFAAAQEALGNDEFAVAQMRYREAMLREEIGDNAGALNCCLQVIATQPDNHDAVASTIRLAGPQGLFEEMVKAMLAYAEERDAIPYDLIGAITAFADGESWRSVCDALSRQAAESELSTRHQAELHWRVAGWQLNHLGETTAAVESLKRSIQLDNNRADTLSSLAKFQSEDRNEELYTTLRRLCEIDSSNLQHFIDAAELAIEILDHGAQRQSLVALQARAIGAWRGTEPAESERDPQEVVSWTLVKLEELYVQTDQAQRALDLLIEGARLPFEESVSRDMRNRAAGIAADVLEDANSAIDMYRAVLSHDPDDAIALTKLGELYEKQGRLPELLGLKRHALEFVEDPDRLLDLRLEVSALIDQIDQKGGRLELLSDNLHTRPGHAPSIEAVTKLLSSMGRFAELVALLSTQAKTLEEAHELPLAAQLWEQVAGIAENDLQDIETALAAYRKVANLAPNLHVLDSLARLYIGRSQSGAAVPWLEQALELADDEGRPQLVKRLAEAHMAAEHTADAIACLQAATVDNEAPVLDLRMMLASLHRKKEQWQDLADTLTASLPFIESDESLAETAREAASIYHDKLMTPAAAVPALTRALALIPDDKGLRLMMARSQRVAGNLPAAREILDGLIAEYGRRRSKERAAVHVELAHVAKADADLETAMSELELASKMDSGNSQILRALADLSSEQGDYEQAERSLRALLLIVRRQPPGDDEIAVGISEVLYELRHIADVRDDEEKSEELLESVIEAAATSDAEVRRLRRTLLDHKEYDLLAKVIRTRVGLSEDDTSKSSLLVALAEILAGPLEDPGAALDARLDSLELLSEDESLHEHALAMAKEQDEVDKYLSRVEKVIAKQRRSEESASSSALLMRAGNVAEVELQDLARARKHYEVAEECSETPANALFALARVCSAMGDTEEQTRALDQLTNLAMVDGPIGAQADALYKLAELQVVQPELVSRGIEILNKALDVEPRYRQASLILKAAATTSNNDPEVVSLYENSARQSGDKLILLDFLERQASGEATLAQIKEAVDLAKELEEGERAVALLERAVETARQSVEGISPAVWAVLDLARHYASNDKLVESKDLLFEIAYIADQETLLELGLELAAKCQESEDYPLAAEVLEFLRQRDPNVRAVWEPLLALYRSMGEGERLADIVDATLPSLMDPAERTQLRLIKGQFLVDSNRDAEAIDLLRDACLDDPDSIEAAGLLETVLRKDGNEEALSDFLWQRFNDAKDRGNVETVTDVACRLGALLDQLGSDSIDVFQQALAVAPESAPLLRGVISRQSDAFDPVELANLKERLLRQEDPEQAADLALELVDMREALEDGDGVQRALELGQQACPLHEGIRARLEQWYHSSGQWGPLAQMKINQAGAVEDPRIQVSLLREAAAIYRDTLSDFDSCSNILAQAQAITPENAELASELASVLASAGRVGEGITVLGNTLETLSGPETLHLLMLRSDLLRNTGDNNAAIVDLEAALSLDPAQVEPLLLAALDAARMEAAHSGDFERERETTMRMIEVYDGQGNSEGARAMLLGWIARDANDVIALRRLRDMDHAAQEWDGVVTACAHLVRLEEGEEQIRVALLLADAAAHTGANDQGRAGLERAHLDQPENEEVRDRLRTLYGEVGAHRELANLLLADAQASSDGDVQYEKFRMAASIFVNELGDAESAVGPAQSAKELRPDDHGTIVLLTDVLVASGQLDEAVAMLEPAIASHKRRSPDLATLQHRMAKVFGARGEQDEQLAWLKKAFDVDRKDGEIASELAHLATEMGDYDLALKPLRAITLMDDPEPVSRVMALLWEAKIEHARGNRAKAELWAKKALREDPEYSEAEDFLAQIAE
jgi:tetratricopeptide (TPR) repeat protein